MNMNNDQCKAGEKASLTDRQEFLVGANRFHQPLLDYLTDVVGNEFDPPLVFKREFVGNYLTTSSVNESLNMGFDFMLSNPYRTSCFESEGQAVPLASQIMLDRDAAQSNAINDHDRHNLTEYGAVLYTLQNRTDITSLQHVKGKRIGTNQLTSLATHLCYHVLLSNGVHHLQDPKQTIFYQHSDTAIQALIQGDIDIGCAATGRLELFLAQNQNHSEVAKVFRILAPRQEQPIMSNGELFPFAISSPLVPGSFFVAFPHVPQTIVRRVQKELLDIADHADVAPALVACLQTQNKDTCLRNTNTTDDNNNDDSYNYYENYTDECLQECFQSLPPGTIRNCETTPRRALKAFQGIQDTGVGGFLKPKQNFLVRDIQESTKFLLKDDPTKSSCVRMKNIAEAVACPERHFARSSQDIAQECNRTGLPCYDTDCICSPCVKASEVDFFASAADVHPTTTTAAVNHDDYFQDYQQLLRDTTSMVGLGCAKFSICATVEQEHMLHLRAIDNKGRLNATMSGALLWDEEETSEETFVFDYNIQERIFYANFTVSNRRVGQQVLKIRINGDEVPESPYRINIVERNCFADTGDERKEADFLGQCVCESGTVETSGGCVRLAVLLPSILVPVVLLAGVLLFFCSRRKRKVEHAVWLVKKEEITITEPPIILGRGAFGLVMLGEFRGTQVAVKRVIPPRGKALTGNDVEEVTESSMRTGFGYRQDYQRYATSSNPHADSIAPVRDGLAELAAQLSAAGLGHRTTGESRLCYEMKMLEKAFISEMRVLSRLRHPNVTTLMGAVLGDVAGPLLIMEHMEKGSLRDVLQDSEFDLKAEVLLSILQDISQGMRFLHASDPPVLHGDLKGRNILVDSKFRAKVSDFGLSHTQKQARRVGTPFWMAPELLRGETSNTTASDVYSMGIIVYETYAREDPYQNLEPMRVLREVADPAVNRRPRLPPNCPSQIRSLMEECVAANADRRPTFEEVDTRLRRIDVSTCRFDDQESKISADGKDEICAPTTRLSSVTDVKTTGEVEGDEQPEEHE